MYHLHQSSSVETSHPVTAETFGNELLQLQRLSVLCCMLLEVSFYVVSWHHKHSIYKADHDTYNRQLSVIEFINLWIFPQIEI